jgi:replicative DNA helicase
VDYLQLMNASGGSGYNANSNRVNEISAISRSLKEMARELNIPIIALSQLSRGVESRNEKRPMLSDLRDSGAIEQDADIVMLLYRDDYYNQESEATNVLEVNVAKHRNGQIGPVQLHFDRGKMKFTDIDKKQMGHYTGF